MNINNKKSIEYLANNGVIPTEVVSNITNDSIFIDCHDKQGNLIKKRVLIDSVSDDEIYVALEVEKLKTLHSIKSMLKFFTILTAIGLGLGLFAFLGGLG